MKPAAFLDKRNVYGSTANLHGREGYVYGLKSNVQQPERNVRGHHLKNRANRFRSNNEIVEIPRGSD